MSGREFYGAQLGRQHMRADVFQKAPHRDDVAHVRNVMKGDVFGG